MLDKQMNKSTTLSSVACLQVLGKMRGKKNQAYLNITYDMRT